MAWKLCVKINFLVKLISIFINFFPLSSSVGSSNVWFVFCFFEVFAGIGSSKSSASDGGESARLVFFFGESRLFSATAFWTVIFQTQLKTQFRRSLTRSVAIILTYQIGFKAKFKELKFRQFKNLKETFYLYKNPKYTFKIYMVRSKDYLYQFQAETDK